MKYGKDLVDDLLKEREEDAKKYVGNPFIPFEMKLKQQQENSGRVGQPSSYRKPLSKTLPKSKVC